MSSTRNKKSPFTQNGKKGGSTIKSIPLLVLLAVIIVAFVVTPVLAKSGMGGIDDFGRFGNIPIRHSQGNYFAEQVDRFNDMYRDYMYDNPDYFEIYRRNIWQSAYNETVIYTATKYFMEKSGFGISSSKLDRMVVESGRYNDSLGKFDSELYSSTPIAQKESFRTRLSEYQTISQFRSDLLDGVYNSDEQIQFISETSPEERMIGFITIDSNMIPQEIIIEEGEKNYQFFQTRDLSRIVVETEKEAKNVIEQLNEDTSNFAEVAISSSRDYTASEGGSIPGRFYYEIVDELSAETADILFAMTNGDITDPIETEYGWYIYKADSEVTQPDFSNDIMLNKVKTWLNWNHGEVLEQWAMNEAAEVKSGIDPADPGSFALSAYQKGYEVKQSGYFTLNWGGSPLVGASVATGATDTVLQSATKSEDFFTAVFSLELDEISEPISLGKTIVIVQLMDIRDSQSKISDLYVKRYLQQFRDNMWNDICTESDLLVDNFEESYNQIFPSTGI